MFILTIDGPAASGKTTLARMVAERLGYGLVHTGHLYRGLGYLLARRGWTPGCAVEPRLGEITVSQFQSLTEGEIGTEDVARVAMASAQEAAAREFVTSVVRAQVDELARTAAGVVVEGRDTGTVVFPQAKLKVFLDPPLAIRVARRASEGSIIPGSPAFHDLAAALKRRDDADRSRAHGPLARAPDAMVFTEDESAAKLAHRVASRAIAVRAGQG